MLNLSKLPLGPPPKVKVRETKALKRRAATQQDRELRVKSYLHGTNVIERIGPEQARASGAVVPVTSDAAARAYKEGEFNRALLATSLYKYR
jgi:hypothetical protein